LVGRPAVNDDYKEVNVDAFLRQAPEETVLVVLNLDGRPLTGLAPRTG
jgi:hypothetical protein